MLPVIKQVLRSHNYIRTKQLNTCNLSTQCQSTITISCLPGFRFNNQSVRYKSKGNKKQLKASESENETESSDYLDDITDKNIKTLKVNVNSLRIDAIIKSGLGISRNKIETIFYESKIRLNGEKIMKKSVNVKEGDEIDVIKGVSVTNPNFLTVARVEVLSATDKGESLNVKIRRNKSLTVENYKDKWVP